MKGREEKERKTRKGKKTKRNKTKQNAFAEVGNKSESVDLGKAKRYKGKCDHCQWVDFTAK